MLPSSNSQWMNHAPTKTSKSIFQEADSLAVRSAWCNLNTDWEEIRRLRKGIIWLGFVTFLVIWCCTYNLYGSLLPLYKNKKWAVVMFKWGKKCENKHLKILTKVWVLLLFLNQQTVLDFSLFFPYFWTNNSYIFLKTKLSTNPYSSSLRK